MNILKALKRNYRYNTNKGGAINTEQLFQLGQQDLHELYLSLEGQVQTSKGLLGRKGNGEIENKMAIVKAIFEDKQRDAEKAETRQNNAGLKQVILTAAAQKEQEELLDGKSAAELRKMAKDL